MRKSNNSGVSCLATANRGQKPVYSLYNPKANKASASDSDYVWQAPKPVRR